MTDDQYTAKDAELIRAEQEFARAKGVHCQLESAWAIMAALENKDFIQVKIEVQTKAARHYQLHEINDGLLQLASVPAAKLHPAVRNAAIEYYRALRVEFSQL